MQEPLTGKLFPIAAPWGYAVPSVGWNIAVCFCFVVWPDDCFFLEMGMFPNGLSTSTVNSMQHS